MHALQTPLSMRASSHRYASTSGREVAPSISRTRRLQVQAALFEPPPFQPKKLSVQYLAGARPPNSLSAPLSRRYTLTHNDITGALNLSIGSDYNHQQIQGFYTRILRDEITAEWYITSGAAAPAELHIYCHVSGEERWLAPPQLRNFIFRREMTLVLDTFYYADKEFLQSFPDLMKAKVYVHFQSDVQDLDLREYWGTLGDRRSWRRMPRGVLARLKLLLFGFPALPHQRPRTALTWQQQQRQRQRQQQQQDEVGLVPVAAVAGARDVVSQQDVQQQQQWHLSVEAVVEQTRPVALSLQEQRRLHSQEAVDQQSQERLPIQQGSPVQSANINGNGNGHSSEVAQSAGIGLETQQRVAQRDGPREDLGPYQPVLAGIAAEGSELLLSNGDQAASSSSPLSNGANGDGYAPVHGNGSSGVASNGRNSSSNGTQTEAEPLQQQSEQVEQVQQLVSSSAVPEQLQQPSQQQVVQQREQVLAFTDTSEVLQEYGYWLRPPSSSCTSRPGVSAGALVPVVAVDKSLSGFQTGLQQQSVCSMRSAVVAAAGRLNGGSPGSNKSS